MSFLQTVTRATCGLHILTSEVKIAGSPPSNISSTSSYVFVLPAN